MRKQKTPFLLVSASIIAILTTGCVERTLTINTLPQGAMVTLNDEQIGESPVTVSFNWYGDYNVRISKPGFQTLKTHRKLKAPLHDKFPFDFFAQVLNPKRIIDSYEWTFELSGKEPISSEQLIEDARNMKKLL